MNQKKKPSLPSVNRSVVQVSPPDLDAYFASFPEIGRKPGEFTRYDASKRWGITPSSARERLEQDVAAGKIKRREGIENKRATVFYSIA